MWDGLELSNRATKPDNIRWGCFSPENLEIIENGFRLILECSNIIGRIDVEESELVTVSSDRAVRIRFAHGSRSSLGVYDNSPTIAPALDSTTEVQTPSFKGITIPSSGSGTFPNILCLKSILCTMGGHILWVMVPELASLELMFHLLTRCDLAWYQVEYAMQERGFSLPETVHQLDLCTMSKRDIFNGKKKKHRTGWFIWLFRWLLYPK